MVPICFYVLKASNACILSFLSVADSWLANVETPFANGSRACLSRRATVSN